MCVVQWSYTVNFVCYTNSLVCYLRIKFQRILRMIMPAPTCCSMEAFLKGGSFKAKSGKSKEVATKKREIPWVEK